MTKRTIFSICDNPIYNIEEFLSHLDSNPKAYKKRRGAYYLNIPCAFDIEASSFYIEGQKCAAMYAFVIGVNGYTYIGRTWRDCIDCFNAIANFFNLSESRHIIVYVHNLEYDFQFFRHYFEWEKVFADKPRQPLTALTKNGIEFRCSYRLSGYSLKTVGKNLQTYHVEKMVGDLDYDKIRTHLTPLTEQEIKYIVHDGLVVMAYIEEEIERLGNILKIPLTKTGYVRKFTRKSTLGEHYKKYKLIMNTLKITSLTEYTRLKEAFQGGFTHASAWHSGDLLQNVCSYDFTSSYPAVMVYEKYPMSSAEKRKITSREQFDEYIKSYCCLFVIRLKNVKSSFIYERTISLSKCRNVENAIVDNGRIDSADSITMTITDVDYITLKKFYTWESAQIGEFYTYRRGYLPTAFIDSILTLYGAKTELKGVAGCEVEYMHAKEQLNSEYGQAVTDFMRDIVTYSDDWNDLQKCNPEEEITRYNESKSRFLFYPWGIWVTAYARRNVLSGVYEFGPDYVYSDTDSVKGLNREAHSDYINKFDSIVERKLRKACEYHKIPFSRVCPKTKDGKEKLLGVWDYEGTYDEFKTLGAKRYMTKKGNEYSLTVSGLNKYTSMPYLLSKGNPFDQFNDEMTIPSDYSGRLTHTYIDEPRSGEVTDYLGTKAHFSELSSIHMEKSEFTLNVLKQYMEFLQGIKTRTD